MHTHRIPTRNRLFMRFPLFVSNHYKSKLKLLFAIFSFYAQIQGGKWSTTQRLSVEWKTCTILLQWTRLIFVDYNHIAVDVSEKLAKIMNRRVLSF